MLEVVLLQSVEDSWEIAWESCSDPWQCFDFEDVLSLELLTGI